jgi:Protein of unknown function (DUF4230)
MNSGTKSRNVGRAKSPILGPILGKLITMGSGAALLLAIVAGYGVIRSGQDFWAGLGSAFVPKTQDAEVTARAVTLQQIRQANELTTAIFTMETVVPTQQASTLGGFTIGKTTLLYIARGEVRAGVDLSKVQPEDVTIAPNLIRIRLPSAQILDQKIDVTRSEVYDYDRGFLGLGPDQGPQMQQIANQTALIRIVEAACSQNILTQATQRAQTALTQLLGASGKQVLIDSQPQGLCAPANATAATPSPATVVPPLVAPAPIAPPAQ